MVEYRVISPDEWEKLPPIGPKKSDEFDPILNDLANGHIVEVPYRDEKDRRSKRVSISRRASLRGFKVEARVTENAVAFKKVDVRATSADRGSGAKSRGRRKSQES